MPEHAVAMAQKDGEVIGYVVPDPDAPVIWVDVPEGLDTSHMVTIQDPSLLERYRGQRMVLLPFSQLEEKTDE